MQNCKLAPGKIKLIGHPHRLLVKVWADVSTIPPELQTALRNIARSGKKKQRSRAKHSIKTKLPSACQLVEHLNHAKLSELTSPNCTISHSTRLLSLHPLCNFTVSLKLEINIGLCGFSSSEARIMALLWLLLLHQKKKYL